MTLFWMGVRILVGGLFAYAGFSKLILPVEDFQAILAEYEVIPVFLISVVAHILPWMEWLCGSLLLLGFGTRWMAAVLALLTFLFLMVLISSFLIGSGTGQDCGCFGSSIFHFSRTQIFGIDISILLFWFGFSF